MKESATQDQTPKDNAPIITDADMAGPDGFESEIGYRAFNPEIRWHSDGERTTVQIMTGNVARDGFIIDPKGLSMTNYRKNPVVLWHHGWDIRGKMPVGMAKNIRMSKAKDSWLADVTFDEDEFSQMLKAKVKSGSVRAVSIGWITKQREWIDDVLVIKKAELTEFSFVAVPSDPDAIVQERTYAGIMDRLTKIEERFAQLEATAQPEVQPEKQEPAKAAPAPPVAPVQRQATAEDYTQLVGALMPMLEGTLSRIVDTAIEKRTGQI